MSGFVPPVAAPSLHPVEPGRTCRSSHVRPSQASPFPAARPCSPRCCPSPSMRPLEASLTLKEVVVETAAVSSTSTDLPAAVDVNRTASASPRAGAGEYLEALVAVPGLVVQNRQNYAQDLAGLLARLRRAGGLQRARRAPGQRRHFRLDARRPRSNWPPSTSTRPSSASKSCAAPTRRSTATMPAASSSCSSREGEGRADRRGQRARRQRRRLKTGASAHDRA